jgi:hypothetical protein
MVVCTSSRPHPQVSHIGHFHRSNDHFIAGQQFSTQRSTCGAMADHPGEFENNAALTATASGWKIMNHKPRSFRPGSAGDNLEGLPQGRSDDTGRGSDFQVDAQNAASRGLQSSFDRIDQPAHNRKFVHRQKPPTSR